MSAERGAGFGEKSEVRERIAAAVYEAEGWGNDLPAADPDHWPSKSAYRVADAVLDALQPDDLDLLVGSEAKDAESVYWFAKDAVKADRARLPRHRDIFWHDWNQGITRRRGWLAEGLPYDEPVFSSVEGVTDLHDGDDCPFLDSDELPMVESDEPMVIAAPDSARGEHAEGCTLRGLSGDYRCEGECLNPSTSARGDR